MQSIFKGVVASLAMTTMLAGAASAELNRRSAHLLQTTRTPRPRRRWKVWSNASSR